MQVINEMKEFEDASMIFWAINPPSQMGQRQEQKRLPTHVFPWRKRLGISSENEWVGLVAKKGEKVHEISLKETLFIPRVSQVEGKISFMGVLVFEETRRSILGSALAHK